MTPTSCDPKDSEDSHMDTETEKSLEDDKLQLFLSPELFPVLFFLYNQCPSSEVTIACHYFPKS